MRTGEAKTDPRETAPSRLSLVSAPGPIPAHPAAELFPLMEGPAFDALIADIKLNGLISPLVLYEGLLLDGRNRYRACQRLGLEPQCVEWDGSGGSPEAFVVTVNLRRRQLTAAQLACVGAELMPYFKRDAAERQRGHGGTAPGRRKNTPDRSVRSVGRARDHAGTAVGVSGVYVGQAKRLRDTAPEIFELVKKGLLAMEPARKLARSVPAEQRSHVVKLMLMSQSGAARAEILKSSLGNVGRRGTRPYRSESRALPAAASSPVPETPPEPSGETIHSWPDVDDVDPDVLQNGRAMRAHVGAVIAQYVRHACTGHGVSKIDEARINEEFEAGLARLCRDFFYSIRSARAGGGSLWEARDVPLDDQKYAAEVLGAPLPKLLQRKFLDRVFRRRAAELHPDRNADPAANREFKALSEAYEVLKPCCME